MIMKFGPIYKRDTKGGVRVWVGETKDDGEIAYHRTISGLIDGQKVESEWKAVKGKSIGRSNETTAIEQANSEMESKMKDRLTKGYFDSISKIDDKPLSFKPMLAGKYGDLKKPLFELHNRVHIQPKLDGIRCVATKDGMFTRNGKQHLSCPHIEAVLREFFEINPNVVLDGELYNHDLKDNFDKLASLIRKSKPTEEDLAETARTVEYHIYDAFFEDEPDLPFNDRYFKIVNDELVHGSMIEIVDTYAVSTQEGVDTKYGEWLEQGYEGQMVRLDSPYELKRSKSLLKRKEFVDEEFPVIRVEEGEGNWAGAVKRFVIQLPNGNIAQPHPRGSRESMKALWESGKTPDWAKVRYQNYTPDGVLRFPTVLDYGYGERND